MGRKGSVSTAWLLLLLLGSCCACCFAAHHGRNHQQQQSNVVVVGTVHSESEPKNFISGAPITVECSDATSRRIFQRQAVTDGRGAFRFRLPPELTSGSLSSITSCSLHLLEPNASRGAAAASTAGLRLVAARRGGPRVFSAGSFAVRPPPRPDPRGRQALLFPPIPFVPEPPNVGGVPVPPNPLTPAPPPLLPPNPLTPSPPPLLSPLPFQPSPPPPFLRIPPVWPFLAPPPPPPPRLPFVPPLPFFPPFRRVPPPPPAALKTGPSSP